MTKYFDQFGEDQILADKCVILLKESIAICRDKGTNKVKRSLLLKLCNTRLNELTKGERSDFGGSFEACLKKYSDPNISPAKRLVTVERSNVKHNTQIYPNIDLIEKHLQARKISYAYADPARTTKTIHVSLFDSVPPDLNL